MQDLLQKHHSAQETKRSTMDEDEQYEDKQFKILYGAKIEEIVEIIADARKYNTAQPPPDGASLDDKIAELGELARSYNRMAEASWQVIMSASNAYKQLSSADAKDFSVLCKIILQSYATALNGNKSLNEVAQKQFVRSAGDILIPEQKQYAEVFERTLQKDSSVYLNGKKYETVDDVIVSIVSDFADLRKQTVQYDEGHLLSQLTLGEAKQLVLPAGKESDILTKTKKGTGDPPYILYDSELRLTNPLYALRDLYEYSDVSRTMVLSEVIPAYSDSLGELSLSAIKPLVASYLEKNS